MKESQNKQILNHMQAGYKITDLQALLKFGCRRLSARIHDIKYILNQHVDDEWITTKSKKRVKQYYIK